MTDDTRLNENDADEWFEVGRMLNPSYTREQFDRDWEEFQDMKRRRASA